MEIGRKQKQGKGREEGERLNKVKNQRFSGYTGWREGARLRIGLQKSFTFM